MIWRKIIFSIHLSPALQLSSPWSPIILVSPKLSLQRGISKSKKAEHPKNKAEVEKGIRGESLQQGSLKARLPRRGCQQEEKLFNSLKSFSITQDFPGGPMVKAIDFHCGGVQVWSLVKELRSCVLCNMAKKKLKKNFLNKPKRADFKMHFGIERAGSWTYSVLAELSFSHLYSDTLCLFCCVLRDYQKPRGFWSQLPAPREPTVFAEKHEVTLPSTYMLYSPFRLWGSRKRRYINIELHENITGVFLKHVASLGNLCRVFFLFRWLLCHSGNN